jgi:hypothetical protein
MSRGKTLDLMHLRYSHLPERKYSSILHKYRKLAKSKARAVREDCNECVLFMSISSVLRALFVTYNHQILELGHRHKWDMLASSVVNLWDVISTRT